MPYTAYCLQPRACRFLQAALHGVPPPPPPAVTGSEDACGLVTSVYPDGLSGQLLRLKGILAAQEP